jgi:uncharacterized protein (DUF1501 family)
VALTAPTDRDLILRACRGDTDAYGELVTRYQTNVFNVCYRILHEHGSLGTDHGHGSKMMVLGGHVDGGKVYGEWSGLEEGQMVGPGDLAVTTDYRDVLAEILVKRLNNTATNEIFPDYQARRTNMFF